MNNYRIVFSPRAQQRLEEIADYLYQQPSRVGNAFETVKVLLHNQRDIIYLYDKHNN